MSASGGAAGLPPGSGPSGCRRRRPSARPLVSVACLGTPSHRRQPPTTRPSSPLNSARTPTRTWGGPCTLFPATTTPWFDLASPHPHVLPAPHAGTTAAVEGARYNNLFKTCSDVRRCVYNIKQGPQGESTLGWAGLRGHSAEGLSRGGQMEEGLPRCRAASTRALLRRPHRATLLIPAHHFVQAHAVRGPRSADSGCKCAGSCIFHLQAAPSPSEAARPPHPYRPPPCMPARTAAGPPGSVGPRGATGATGRSCPALLALLAAFYALLPQEAHAKPLSQVQREPQISRLCCIRCLLRNRAAWLHRLQLRLFSG